jgi:hypothetical protein
MPVGVGSHVDARQHCNTSTVRLLCVCLMLLACNTEHTQGVIRLCANGSAWVLAMLCASRCVTIA